ncbi:prophage endopeptidase tail family protein [Caminicella sporogenes]|uniref:prophage endopeptidase tail family protein n=1 Tax=Caminicella sporogenes TaxID=166485 RepID=UPI002542360B|nr:prophage endopeptidase tail family protein [Caminicella sporogenes]WIF94317.1 prophage endopeptidase tail family protein [Caminicella sporogenes]
MEYPIIKDKNGNKLSILNNITNATIKEQINGEYIFTFTAIIEDLKTDYIHYDNLIEIENNLFQIAKYTKERTQDNKLLINALAEHISYKLLDYTLDNFIYDVVTPTEILLILLQDTEFTIGTVNVGGTNNIKIEQTTNKRAVLNEIITLFGGEFKFDKYEISLLTQRGRNTGVQFRVGKNIKGIKKTVDNTQKDKQGNPKISYEIDILELNELDEFKGLEGFELGDTVRIIDEDLGIDIYARILEIEYNPLQRRNTRVVLGNFIDNIATEQINLKRTANLVASRSQIWDRAEIITPQKTIYTQYLEGEISALQNAVKAGAGTVTITEDNGILITDQPTIEQSTKAIRLLGGVLAISNEKDANGNWIWRTFGTGDGFTADEIVSGKILSNLIDAGTITLDMLSQATKDNFVEKGTKFDNSIVIGDGNGIKVLDSDNNIRVHLGQYAAGKFGVKVTKGEIYSTTIQTSEEGATTYIRLDENGDFSAYKDGERIIFMQASANEGRIRLGDGKGDPYALSIIANHDVNSTENAAIIAAAPKGLYLGGGGSSLHLRYDGGINVGLGNGSEMYVDGNFFVTGSKNALVFTENYGDRLMYAYESPESKFFDEGIAKIENGICRIDLDPIFLETIEPHSITPYIIHLTPYDWLNLRVAEISDSYFIVEEKEGLSGKFAWKLSAVRKGYAGERMKRVDLKKEQRKLKQN